MSLFGKLIGEAAKKLVRTAIDSVQEKQASQPARTGPVSDPPANPAAPASAEQSPAIYVDGVMPDEENQYNYGGSYVDYFDHVFRSDFPGYVIVHAPARGRAATIFTFSRNDQTALIVELLSETSSAKKLRADCAASGIPYLRFYYNHDGWWNTRSYVSGRVRKALGL